MQIGADTRYRFVRPIDDAEIDAEDLENKLKRDLMRLLDVLNLARSEDIPAFVRDYFDL